MKNNKKIYLAVFAALVFTAYYSFTSYSIVKVISHKDAAKTELKNTADNSIYENDNSVLKDNEDLLNVDYKAFYEDLKPYGTWVSVNLSNKKVNVNSDINEKGISEVLRNVLNIKDAKADVDFGWSMFYVWKPSPNIAIGISAGEPYPAYIPYTNGRWVYSDYGWYFRAATPYEEITHHYGRWVFVPAEGWIWVPGSRWAPSWVSWEEDDDYVVWSPGSPGIYLAAEYFGEPYYPVNNYIVCERRHFLDPDVYRFSHEYREHEFVNRYGDMRRAGDLTFAGRNEFHRGPDAKRFERDFGKRITPVNIKMVSDKMQVRYNKRQYDVYTPLSAGKNHKGGDYNNSNKQNISRKNENSKNQIQSFGRQENKDRRYNSTEENRKGNSRDKNQNYSKNGKNDINPKENVRKRRDNTSFGKQDNKNGNRNRGNEKYNTGRKNNNGNYKQDNGNRNIQNKRNNNYFSPGYRQNRNNVSGRKYMDDTKMHPGNEVRNQKPKNEGGYNKTNSNKNADKKNKR